VLWVYTELRSDRVKEKVEVQIFMRVIDIDVPKMLRQTIIDKLVFRNLGITSANIKLLSKNLRQGNIV
jgi:hypothetical protein